MYVYMSPVASLGDRLEIFKLFSEMTHNSMQTWLAMKTVREGGHLTMQSTQISIYSQLSSIIPF